MVRVINIATIKTASRHFVPITKSNVSRIQPTMRSFSSVKRDFKSTTFAVEASPAGASAAAEEAAEIFEPTIHGDESVLTAGPVNRA
ncbi:uncharacterized protein LODBEIA_P19380 [Lodderomyces beijingensis]|uniref:Uncharacterized protein n=1 Tax=Lodderomyces beijingensis TaxID=1775926 RepID=A0ABP0ZIL5_9ASCO